MVKEVETLMKMAVNWRKCYETWLTGDGDEYLYEEFMDEITIHLLPYVNRLYETGYLSKNDSKALVMFYLEQIEYLKELSRKMTAGDPVELWR
jgi:hypothetical protein